MARTKKVATEATETKVVEATPVVESKATKKVSPKAKPTATAETFLEKKLLVVEDLAFKNAKTKNALDAMKALKVAGKVLLVGETSNENVALAVRNLSKVNYVIRQQLSAVDVMNADFVVIAKPALTKIEEVLQ